MTCKQYTNKIAILAAIETTYGVDPNTGYTAILANETPEASIEGDIIERTIVVPDFSPLGHVIGAKRQMSSMELEVKGGGVDGGNLVDPEMDKLLRACSLKKVAGKLLLCDGYTGTFDRGEEIRIGDAAATVATHTGTEDLSTGYDWASTNEDFSINVNGAGATTVNLTVLTTDVATTVTAINNALTAAGVEGVEAFASGINVGIRTLFKGTGQSFILATGTTDALVTLGWSAATYTGTGTEDSIGTLALFDVDPLVSTNVNLWTEGALGTYTENYVITGVESGATAVLTGDGISEAYAYDTLVYRPTSNCTEQESISIRFSEDGIRKQLTGVRGNVTMTFESGQYGRAAFEMTGLYNDPTDQTLPAVTVSTILPPVCFSAGLTIGDYPMDKAATTTFEVGLGNNIVEVQDINAAEGLVSIEITDRAPTFSVNPDVVLLADYDIYDIWKNATPVDIKATFGTQLPSPEGQRLHVAVPRGQFDSVSTTDRDLVRAYELPGKPTRYKGDDELYFIFY